ncbi:Hypothetical protein CINCED_3A019706 [Cinara cedri]|uniref:HAT, C-terminal dimerisation domain n=1 Tax=Cinara cedri TaxID=506608 RepID=A0A5E4NIS8_9HEMI|nr:Hypothetical protein CINCED_3A019706 [Cinara cedri]
MEEKNDEDLMTYCQHLEALHSDFNKRFEDILKMDILKWVLDPFSNTETIDSAKLEEELIEVTTNKELKLKFKEAIVQTFLIAFPSSYLVERGFSAVTNLFTKKRQRLQITNRGDLRILLTKIEPNINELLVKHQPHPSH